MRAGGHAQQSRPNIRTHYLCRLEKMHVPRATPALLLHPLEPSFGVGRCANERLIYGHNIQVPVDPSVVISLKTRWEVLQPTRAFTEGCMLPLAGVLDTNKHVK